MSSTSVLEQILAQIEKSNKPARSAALPGYSISGKKGIAAPNPAAGSGVVNPITSKGSTKDGGVKGSASSAGHGALNFLGNLASDVKDTVVGIPGGLVQTVEHPIGTAEAVGKDYRRRYGPLLGYLNGGGDIGKFGHIIEQHPLAPILDVASLATGGGALAAKVGGAASTARVIEGAQAANAAKAAGEVSSTTSGARTAVAALTKQATKVKSDLKMATDRANNLKSPVDVQASSARAVLKHQATLEKLGQKISEHTAHIASSGVGHTVDPLTGLPKMLQKLQGATAGGVRMMKVDPNVEASGIRVPLPHNPVLRARRNLGLSIQEKLPRGLDNVLGPFSLASRARKGAALEQMSHAANARALVHGAVNDAAAHMEKVAKKGGPALSVMHIVADHIVNGTDPLKYAQMVRDHRSTMTLPSGTTKAAHLAEGESILKPHLSKEVNDLFHATQRAMTERTLAAGGDVAKTFRSQKGLHIPSDSPAVQAIMKYRDAHSRAALDAAAKYIKAGRFSKDALDAQRVLQYNLVREAQGRARLTAAQTDKLFQKAGLPPVSYNPDTLTLGDAGKKTSLNDSKGTLYQQGTRVFSPKNIVNAHDLASHATDAVHAHDMLLSAATHIPEGKVKPTGWVWVKDKIPQSMAEKHAIGAEQRDAAPHTAAEHYHALQSEKTPAGRMALPSHAFHDISQGQAGMAAARIEAVSKAASAWKHGTLGFRPGFLTTNIGSNQWMFHMKSGWNFASMRRAKAALASGVAKEFHAAETSGGSTWGGFEKMHGAEKAGSKTAKAKGLGNTFYNIVGAHEHMLRNLSMYETARRLPQVRREIARLKGGKLDTSEKTLFHQAYAAAVHKHPFIQDLVSKNIDDAAGNYRYFTHGEQMLKNFVPFYSWDRHSVRGLVRLMEDNPAKMALLNQIGMQGNARFARDFGNKDALPEFMRSYVKSGYITALASSLGLGSPTAWDSRSQNPYQTGADIVQTFSGSQGQQQRAISGLMGPLVAAPIEQFMGKSLLTGSPLPKSDFKNPILQMIERTIKALPPVKITSDLATNAGAHKKMLPATRGQTGAGYFGIYLRNPQLGPAKKVATTTKAADAKLNAGPHAPAKKKVKAFTITPKPQ